MASRRWGQWPGRIVTEASATGGVVGIAGLGLAAVGAVIAAPITAGIGTVLLVGAGAWTVYRAVPPRLHSPDEMVGKVFRNLADLNSIDPPLRRMGFVGPTRAGKSTLLAHLQTVRAPDDRTDNPYATVIVLQTTPSAYFALIDAAGQQYSQQFKVVDNADLLIIFVDHDIGDTGSTIDQQRLRIHEEFLDQLDGHLQVTGKSVTHFHFLLNKKDLWETTSNVSDLREWFANQVSLWRRHHAGSVSSSEHSNRRTSDVTAFIQLLRRLTDSSNP